MEGAGIDGGVGGITIGVAAVVAGVEDDVDGVAVVVSDALSVFAASSSGAALLSTFLFVGVEEHMFPSVSVVDGAVANGAGGSDAGSFAVMVLLSMIGWNS